MNGGERGGVWIVLFIKVTHLRSEQFCHRLQVKQELFNITAIFTWAAPTRDGSLVDFSLLNVRHSEPTSTTL